MTKITLACLEKVLLLHFLCCALVFCSEGSPDDDDSTESDGSQEPEDFSCHCASPPVTEYDNDNCFSITFKKDKGSDDKSLFKNFESRSNINPFLDCMSCIAIAKELSKAACLHNEKYQKLTHREKEHYPFPCYLDLREVCARNFIGFDLQEKKSMKVLAPSSFNGKHVPVPNVNWSKKLKEQCLVYVSHYGIENIYEELVTNAETGLIDELCK